MAIIDIALACQGGGSHAAFTAGVLPTLLPGFENADIARFGRDHFESDNSVRKRNLIGISGTSGGAISALLGWYGFITGGPDQASAKLSEFWEANSAIKFMEWQDNTWRLMIAELAGQECDVKWTPYGVMFEGLNLYTKWLWPWFASWLTENNAWMRADYFDLAKIIGRIEVDWQLIGAIGDFASIQLEVERWSRSALEVDLFPASAPCQDRYHLEKKSAEQRITRKLGEVEKIMAKLDQLAIPDDAVLRVAFKKWKRPDIRFDRESLEKLKQSVQDVMRVIPHLLLGSVELHRGEFVCFSSERSPTELGISLNAVLASTALPWVVEAPHFEGTDPKTGESRKFLFWDGLFSQNPPIKNFLSHVDDKKKPSEIWVVQINPDEAKMMSGHGRHDSDRIDLRGGEIWALRDSLSGNLSLTQEIDFVDAINRRVAKAKYKAGKGGRITQGAVTEKSDSDVDNASADRLVRVDRIVMDEAEVEAAAGVRIGAYSKADRRPELKDALYRHGQQQGRRYLGLRDQIESLCGGLGRNLSHACETAAKLNPDAAEATMSTWAKDIGRTVLPVRTTLHSVGTRDTSSPQAIVRWRADNVAHGGKVLSIEGETELFASANPGTDWHVKDVRIIDVSTPD